MTKAVIFDMDGVISDTQVYAAEIEEQILKEIGIEMSAAEITEKYAGVSDDEFFGELIEKFGVEADIDELIKLKWERTISGAKGKIKEIPGIRELLEDLREKNYKIALASGAIHEFIEIVVNELGLKEYFIELVSSEDVENGKPAPDIFLLAAEKISVKPEDCTVIEDGIPGMIAAKKAGMYCIGLVKDKSREYPADVLVSKLNEIKL